MVAPKTLDRKLWLQVFRNANETRQEYGHSSNERSTVQFAHVDAVLVESWGRAHDTKLASVNMCAKSRLAAGAGSGTPAEACLAMYQVTSRVINAWCKG